ncbi:hypothetical protein CRE_30868 [Caenorhabditis remanei]|uniref:Uncharacterized protein n=1 Tax=Caenorhabditis remanei TaxID=31234 RepID=E3LUQ4_CAERE|nr:hypothetical protein CRE_30868 [Caenorhabditis remanei]
MVLLRNLIVLLMIVVGMLTVPCPDSCIRNCRRRGESCQINDHDAETCRCYCSTNELAAISLITHTDCPKYSSFQ